jgi:hypothetical protein
MRPATLLSRWILGGYRFVVPSISFAAVSLFG